MFRREEVEKILNQAESIDPKHDMFGVSAHQYKLNPPVSRTFVHDVEEKYHFLLPEDYVQFITEVGDGGAGPDYGICPFKNILAKGSSPGAEKFREAYRYSLSKAFEVRSMKAAEVEEYAFAREAYEKNPDKYFVNNEIVDDYTLCNTKGYYVLGTHGCQWDFGLITAGERCGQIFDTDNEGGYVFVADSFSEFYQNWLDYISDTEQFQRDVEKWKKIRKR